MARSMRRASPLRTLRSLGGRLIRRAGLLPGGMPDGLGEDEALTDAVWPGRVLVYFSETPEGLYQIEGWYPVLRALDAEHGVTVVCADSRVAAAIRRDSGLTVHTVAQEATLEGLLERSDLRLCLYVNNHPLNFVPLRFRSLTHVCLLHGDSDKIVTVSNQVKAYDAIFVAGQAGVDRYAQYVPFFDAAERCVIVGRPQLDAVPRLRDTAAQPNPTVLYAPTWEGAGPTVAYGSAQSHGHDLVRSLIDAGLAVVYRPHPLSGVREPAYGEADTAIRGLVAQAAERDPSAGHRVSTSGPLEDDFARADLLVCDVSAVASDWLATGRPIVITSPTSSTTQVARTRMLETVPRLVASDVLSAGELALAQIRDDPGRSARTDLIEYYFGDVTPGAATQRLLDACTAAIRQRDEEWSRLERLRAGTD